MANYDTNLTIAISLVKTTGALYGISITMAALLDIEQSAARYAVIQTRRAIRRCKRSYERAGYAAPMDAAIDAGSRVLGCLLDTTPQDGFGYHY